MHNTFTKSWAFIALFLLPALAAGASQKINPASQINWPLVTGTTPPGGSCASSNYGQPYTNTTNGNFYVCGSSGWVLITTGGGGLSGQTAGYYPKATTATTSTGPGIISDDGTTATIHGPTVVNDGTGNAGHVGITQGTATSNDTTAVTLTAPTSVTSYRIQLPGVHSTSGNTFLSCTAADPSVCTWSAGGGGGSIYTCADSSGSGTAQSCTASPTLASLSVNTCIAYTSTTTNSGALTLNVSGLGAKSVVKWLGTALASGDNVANKSQVLCYDGTNWNLSTIGNAPAGANVTSGSGYAIPAYASAAGTVVGPSNITSAASLNDLNVPGTMAIGTGNHVSIGALGSPTNWNFDTTSAATARTSLGISVAGTLSPAPPYLTDGTHFFDRDGYQITKPLASPTWLNTTPTSVTAGANGNVVVASTGSGHQIWESQTCTTSVEAVMRGYSSDLTSITSANAPSFGVWVYDVTNSKIYNLQLSYYNTGKDLNALVFTYSGSGSPSFSSSGTAQLFGSYGLSDYLHLKIVKSSTTISLQVSVDGGATYQTLFTQSSIGTLSKCGYVTYSPTANTYVNVISEAVN